MKNIRAFTLAEVLITLGIIGVVATITLSTLIHNFRKISTENRLKHEVSLIQNAIKMAEARYGETSEWPNCNAVENGNENFSRDCSLNILENFLAPELKIIKICDFTNSEECWTKPKSLSDDYGYLTGSGSNNISALLANGTSILMWTGGMEQNSAYMPHFQLWFDIDGPNRGMGKLGGDVFGGAVDYDNNKGFRIISDENNNTTGTYGCSKDVTGVYAGRNCGGLIQENGWKIPKDYPIKF